MEEIPFRASRIFDALRNPARYQILRALAKGPKTPTTLAERLGRPLPNISQHLSLLKKLDIVRYRPKGQQLVYQVKHREVVALLDLAENCVAKMQVQVEGN